jgi:hypothetical protein
LLLSHAPRAQVRPILASATFPEFTQNTTPIKLAGREFLDKTFAATMALGKISNVLGNDEFMVSFMEKPSDWMPGVRRPTS